MNLYQIYKKAVSGQSLPSAYLDMDYLDENIEALERRAGEVPIRIATKSIRSLEVLQYISNRLKNCIGFMAFTMDEACYLADAGLDNILLGYPGLQQQAIENVSEHLKKGKTITLMVDRQEHLDAISEVAVTKGVKVPVCIDVDVSTKFPGVYFGVYRSAIKTKAQFTDLLTRIHNNPNLIAVGLMGYEAQIAGVTDNQPGRALINNIVRSLKKKSIPKIAAKRKELVAEFTRITGEKPLIVNAGGTGSVESSSNESWVNEVTIGSGFLQPALFDGYVGFSHQPAAFYALEVVRCPDAGIYTLHGGGYIASGSAGDDKVPEPYLPSGMKLEKNEGAGEVQTPVHYSGELQLGDPVFFRHAKAGELCERFKTLNLIRDGQLVGSYDTYRGAGRCFL